MKNAKRYLSAIVMFALAAPLFTACDNGLEEFPRTVLSAPSDKFNAKIQFVSRLTDAKLASSAADFTAIDNYLVTTLDGKRGSWLTVLDRIDGNDQDKVMQTALNCKRWTAFAFNRIANRAAYEGSMLFFNTPSILTKGTPSGSGCVVTGITPQMNGVSVERDSEGNIKSSKDVSFPIHFRTVRFESADQIAAFTGKNGVLRGLFYDNMNFLMIGTVKNELFASLQSTVQGGGGFFVERVTEGAAYSIFMLADPRFWGFSGVSSESLGNGVESYTVNVMW